MESPVCVLVPIAALPEVDIETKICEHLDLDPNNYCLNCGIYAMQLVSSKNASTKKQATKTLSDHILKLDIAPEIIVEATRILVDITKRSKKLKKKTKLDFYCLYQAYRNLGINKDTYSLAKMLGMSIKEVNSSLLMYSEHELDSVGIFKNSTAADLLPEYCTRINLDEDQTKKVNLILVTVLKKDPKLAEENPRKLVCSILKYYMGICGMTYERSSFKDNLGFSDATLNNLTKKISNAYVS